MKIKKKVIEEAIQRGANRLFEESASIPEQHLYLTQRQYDADPEGWNKIAKQKGDPEKVIVIIPEVFQP